MSAAKQKADGFKDKGNALFKEGKMLEYAQVNMTDSELTNQ
jgi:hypothetical protein